MSVSGFELRDRVKIKSHAGEHGGMTGMVSALIFNQSSNNIGVVFDSQKQIAPHYFSKTDLVKLAPAM